MVFLHYRKPPLYDETLNKTAIFILKWGAFFYVAIAYWILTNKQMFDNVLDPIFYKDQIEDYHHYIFEIPSQLHLKVLLVYTLVLLIILLTIDLLENFLWNAKLKKFEKQPEGLTPFSQSIHSKDKALTLYEEKTRREKYGYKLLSDDFYASLQNTLPSNSLFLRKQLSDSQSDLSHPIHYITDATPTPYTSYDPLTSFEHALKFSYSLSPSYIPVAKRTPGQARLASCSEFTRLAFEYPFHRDLGLLAKVASREGHE